jgi:hypothetical protein
MRSYMNPPLHTLSLGPTTLFSMLHRHRACGKNTRWKKPPTVHRHLSKERPCS